MGGYSLECRKINFRHRDAPLWRCPAEFTSHGDLRGHLSLRKGLQGEQGGDYHRSPKIKGSLHMAAVCGVCAWRVFVALCSSSPFPPHSHLLQLAVMETTSFRLRRREAGMGEGGGLSGYGLRGTYPFQHRRGWYVLSPTSPCHHDTSMPAENKPTASRGS